MVYFVCQTCQETFKKGKVEAHCYKCPSCWVLSCVDCGKDFPGDAYKTHNSCISEAEKYQGALYRAAPTKTSTIKNMWQDVLEEAAATATDGRTQARFAQILEYDNCPRKRTKFINFIRNSLGLRNDGEPEALWDVIDKIKLRKMAEHKEEQEAAKAAQEKASASATAAASSPADDDKKSSKQVKGVSEKAAKKSSKKDKDSKKRKRDDNKSAPEAASASVPAKSSGDEAVLSSKDWKKLVKTHVKGAADRIIEVKALLKAVRKQLKSDKAAVMPDKKALKASWQEVYPSLKHISLTDDKKSVRWV